MKNLHYSSIVVFLLVCRMAQTETITVSGDVSGEWYVDTVLVAANIQVPPGETLQIEPGVKVLFEGLHSLEIHQNATLIASGVQGDSIWFDVYEGVEYWKGLRFIYSSNYCIIAYSIINAAKAPVISDPFGYFAIGGGISANQCDLTIENSRISNCRAGDPSTNDIGYGGGISIQGGNPLIHNNLIVNNITSGSSSSSGGGIYLNGCEIVIVSCNLIYQNFALKSGGGIKALFCDSLFVYNNIVFNNQMDLGESSEGGALQITTTDWGILTGNIIDRNNASKGGGIYMTQNCNVSIVENILSNNQAEFFGGLRAWDVSPDIFDNKICFNHSSAPNQANAGGIYINPDYPNVPHISYNGLFGNITDGYGGGLTTEEDYQSDSVFVSFNTFYDNEALLGGGIFTRYIQMSTTLDNNILWENLPSQIHNSSGTSLTVNYSNIQNSWPGIGNIDEDPMFVDPALYDYRLTWGSPCIDAGDPDPQYNDPDGTRADMGAFYFDQSVPVRALLTPHEIPYLIAEGGGTFDYTARIDNWDTEHHTVTVWIDAMLPDSTTVGPLVGPVTLTIPASTMIVRERTQTIPGAAPFGVYHYNAYCVVDADTSKDSFMFGKLGTTAADYYTGWGNCGEPLDGSVGFEESDLPRKFALFGAYPNPFNPETVLSYELRVASYTTLTVFDVQGREVATLANGYRDAGVHEVTFDGLGLASGVYMYRLEADGQQAVGKMILMK